MVLAVAELCWSGDGGRDALRCGRASTICIVGNGADAKHAAAAAAAAAVVPTALPLDRIYGTLTDHTPSASEKTSTNCGRSH